MGNLDLLGAELLPSLLSFGVPVVHHVGFVAPPYPVASAPLSPQFRISPASEAVRTSLIQAGFSIPKNRVIYPGARDDLLGPAATGRSLPSPLSGHAKPIGTTSNPLKLCFAGLLMGSKGAHTVIQAMVGLQNQGIHVRATIAGAAFQPEYQTALEDLLERHGMKDQVLFCGNLNRPQLARMYGLHHVGVFASIYPEAFGIVAAEIQASGLALISSGVGGAAEVLDHGQTGLRFQPGNAEDLAQQLAWLAQRPEDLRRIARDGQNSVRQHFSVRASSLELERLLQDRG
ncbi:glycosyltransferase family 4 protein [Synechococcus sp. PROS-U-1]|uniref:glycosyltransferase family 4 protein n=1 Tax=Synechococcus sp. PROS-U-1 TaxID=1400866 RepID=UPI00164792DF|nr:glycosyltransferase family 4 protein [Synechococcus sp. PROS-U-1]